MERATEGKGNGDNITCETPPSNSTQPTNGQTNLGPRIPNDMSLIKYNSPPNPSKKSPLRTPRISSMSPTPRLALPLLQPRGLIIRYECPVSRYHDIIVLEIDARIRFCCTVEDEDGERVGEEVCGELGGPI